MATNCTCGYVLIVICTYLYVAVAYCNTIPTDHQPSVTSVPVGWLGIHPMHSSLSDGQLMNEFFRIRVRKKFKDICVAACYLSNPIKANHEYSLSPYMSNLYPSLFKLVQKVYSKPLISRIQVDREIYLSYAKIRLMRSQIKGFGTIVREILSEICEDPTYANPALL